MHSLRQLVLNITILGSFFKWFIGEYEISIGIQGFLLVNIFKYFFNVTTIYLPKCYSKISKPKLRYDSQDGSVVFWEYSSTLLSPSMDKLDMVCDIGGNHIPGILEILRPMVDRLNSFQDEIELDHVIPTLLVRTAEPRLCVRKVNDCSTQE